jgi:excisionase family DNA binding protein
LTDTTNPATGTIGRLLTIEQLSGYLQVPIQTIYAWRHDGVGPRALKAGRALRYRRSDVDAWLENQN